MDLISGSWEHPEKHNVLISLTLKPPHNCYLCCGCHSNDKVQLRTIHIHFSSFNTVVAFRYSSFHIDLPHPIVLTLPLITLQILQ